MKTSADCIACGDQETQLSFTKNGYDVYVCASCGLHFVHPLPLEKNVDAVYGELYHAGERYSTSRISRAQMKLWQRRLHWIERQTPSIGAILDVGCATGLFLRQATTRGWRVAGLEKSPSATRTAQELIGKENVLTSDFLTTTWPNHFDVVTMWALIEHVPDPRAFLRKANALLAVGGILALATPNSAAFCRSLYGSSWKYFTPPEHIYYFNRKNITELLAQNGFQVLGVKTHFRHQAFLLGTPRLLRLFEQRALARLAMKLLMLPATLLLESMKLGDTMELLARKIRDV